MLPTGGMSGVVSGRFSAAIRIIFNARNITRMAHMIFLFMALTSFRDGAILGAYKAL